MKLPTFLQGIGRGFEPDLLDHNDLANAAEFRPMTELDHFVSKTKLMLDGLDSNIEELDAQITAAIARLNDLKRIRAAQNLALNFMQDGD